MGAKALLELSVMPKWLPAPNKPRTVRLVVDDTELARIDRAAVDCRLSAAAYVRALVVASCDHPEWHKLVMAMAEKIRANSPPGKPGPGRPKK